MVSTGETLVQREPREDAARVRLHEVPGRQAEVETLTAAQKASPNVYVTDFSGLNVLRMTEFRRRLRAAGASYVVVKNTLAQRALAANKIEGLDEHFNGPTGLVLSHDPLAAAKVLTDRKSVV